MEVGRCVMEVLNDTLIPPGLGEEWFAGRHCPRCIWPYLRPAPSLGEAHWLCESCGHCWHIDHDRLRPVKSSEVTAVRVQHGKHSWMAAAHGDATNRTRPQERTHSSAAMISSP